MKQSITAILVVNTFFIAILCSPDLLSAQNPENKHKAEFFPFSVWYSGGDARAPMLSEITPESADEWRADLQQIRDLGFNTVRTWVEWMTVEPVQGQYNFDNLRLLMELAEEVGLKVFIQMYMDSAPDWLAHTYPDALFVTQSGAEVIPQAAPGACPDNRIVREAVMNFYTRTAEVASEYDHFYGWDLWSEPHIINWAAIDYVPNVQFCYCDGTQGRFRQWLRDKYDNLETLNRAWHRTFTEWEQVEAPRFSTILSYTDFIDWKTFIYEKLVEDMSMRYEAVRRGDPDNLITAHAVGASLFQSPYVGAGATDDFMMSGPLDFYGVSIYPKHNHPDRHWSLTTLRTVMDFTRSANREKGGWYVGELQAGPGTIGLLIGNPITPDLHRVWAWSSIAKGAKGINIYAYYPMSSGYESGGYGLINLDGSVTERALRAGEIAAIVDRNQELFLNSIPKQSEIGIVYNPLSQMVGGLQRRDYPEAHTNSLIGYFRAFADHNVPVDFLHRHHLERRELSDYKLVIVPWPIMFTREAADGLREFVENGGRVLAEARLAWNDDRGYAAEVIPGMGLHEVFGVREHEVRLHEATDILLELTDTRHPALHGFETGQMLTGRLYEKSMLPLENRQVDILARLADGNPAITATRYGDGEAILAGSYLGYANHPQPKPLNEQFFLNLVDWAGIERPFTTSHDGNTDHPVEVRLQENPDGYLLFIINHSESDEEVKVDLRIDDGRHNLREVITGLETTVNTQNGVLTLNTGVERRNVQIWEINADNIR